MEAVILPRLIHLATSQDYTIPQDVLGSIPTWLRNFITRVMEQSALLVYYTNVRTISSRETQASIRQLGYILRCIPLTDRCNDEGIKYVTRAVSSTQTNYKKHAWKNFMKEIARNHHEMLLGATSPHYLEGVAMLLFETWLITAQGQNATNVNEFIASLATSPPLERLINTTMLNN